jgi:hypothetical protein
MASVASATSVWMRAPRALGCVHAPHSCTSCFGMYAGVRRDLDLRLARLLQFQELPARGTHLCRAEEAAGSRARPGEGQRNHRMGSYDWSISLITCPFRSSQVRGGGSLQELQNTECPEDLQARVFVGQKIVTWQLCQTHTQGATQVLSDGHTTRLSRCHLSSLPCTPAVPSRPEMVRDSHGLKSPRLTAPS